MVENRIPKRVLEWKPIGRRIRGRPRKRRIEDIEEDIQAVGRRRWRKLCKERAEWKRMTKKAKTHSGLRKPVKAEEEILSGICMGTLFHLANILCCYIRVLR